MPNQPTKESFLNDVKNHTLNILKDDGLYRHLSLSSNGSFFYKFDIVTWPNYLSISGDMGCYVFTRVEDMFTFFRNDNLKVNSNYWAEKVVSEDRVNKLEKFSVEEFVNNIYDHVFYLLDNHSKFEKYLEDKNDNFEWARDNIPEEIIGEIYELINCEDEHECVEKMRNFNSDLISFQDFWDHDYHEYSYQYIWCCYAIVWAIQQYDLVKGDI